MFTYSTGLKTIFWVALTLCFWWINSKNNVYKSLSTRLHIYNIAFYLCIYLFILLFFKYSFSILLSPLPLAHPSHLPPSILSPLALSMCPLYMFLDHLSPPPLTPLPLLLWLLSVYSLFLTHSVFNSILSSLHEFDCFWVFSLRLVASLKPLRSDKTLDMISIFLNLLMLVWCPIMWSIFENIPCAFQNVYFASLGWKALYIPVKSIWSRTLFNAVISFLTFCL